MLDKPSGRRPESDAQVQGLHSPENERTHEHAAMGEGRATRGRRAFDNGLAATRKGSAGAHPNRENIA